ncbi:RidA family protein [Kordiimonas pumila]|uniref:RidA family protein n=1 Tax=Kordiimonas pumila TaxID=2161677 RepID=A0ABV7D6T3_9PROT|nr:RidA family protein [Kordiimonas pumila]
MTHIPHTKSDDGGILFFPSTRPGSPFSRAVQVGNILYLSGQIGNNPDGTLPDSLADQTRNTMTNISNALASLGSNMEQIFKCTIMMEDMTRWKEFNAVYLEFFDAEKLPARSAFGASGLVAGALLEIECCAYAPQT